MYESDLLHETCTNAFNTFKCVDAEGAHVLGELDLMTFVFNLVCILATIITV